MEFLVYILKSERTNRFYIGHTSDLEERLKHHNSGRTKSTKHGVPWVLYFSISVLNRSEAMSLERKLKNLKSHKRLEAYIQNL